MRSRASALLFLLAACLPAAPAPGDSPAVVTRMSRPVRLLRSWDETVKVGGRDVPRRVEVVFDYSAGVAWESFYNADGKLEESRKITQSMPTPSREEIEEAIAILRTDPEFARIFTRLNPVPEGGFLLEEERGRPCGPGSRCVRIFILSPDRLGLIRQVVVDLVKEGIAYRNHVPGHGPGVGR